ncbi:putative integral membrane protein [Cryptosporidium felis]|nr:putative integral membrane protein [Cryptosporidium felis]
MEEERVEDSQNDSPQNDSLFEFRVNSLTDGHLKTISLILMIIISIIDNYSENSYFTYFAKTLLGYIGSWLSFSHILFLYILGKSFYFSTPFKFRHVLISSILKYVPVLICVVFIVTPVSSYLMPELPSWVIEDDNEMGFPRFYQVYLAFIRTAVTKNLVYSKLLNRTLFWAAIPMIKISLFPFTISILCSSYKIRQMKETSQGESRVLLENRRLSINMDGLEYNGLVHKEDHLMELYQDLDQNNSISKRFRFITLVITFLLIAAAHFYIMVLNLGRAFQITYPLRLGIVFIFCLSLFGVLDFLTFISKNYKVALTLHCTIGFLLLAIPSLFTYDFNNLISRYYSFSCFFLLGIWDSSLEFITGKGALHHFKLSTQVKYLLFSIFIYSISVGSKLLWLYDLYNHSEMTPRLKMIGSSGIAFSIYYLSTKKSILIKKKYQWIHSLRSKYTVDPAVMCFLNLFPSKKTLWKVLRKDSFALLAFIPVTTSGITYILTEKLLFGAFESFLTVLFVSPTLTLFLMNIFQIFSHTYGLLRGS